MQILKSGISDPTKTFVDPGTEGIKNPFYLHFDMSLHTVPCEHVEERELVVCYFPAIHLQLQLKSSIDDKAIYRRINFAEGGVANRPGINRPEFGLPGIQEVFEVQENRKPLP